MTRIDLTGTAQTIFEETMDEIDEEFKESLKGLISEVYLKKMIQTLQNKVEEKLRNAITTHHSDQMDDVKKMILGENISRLVTHEAKIILHELSGIINKNSLDLIEILRNEIIGEVFEETE